MHDKIPYYYNIEIRNFIFTIPHYAHILTSCYLSSCQRILQGRYFWPIWWIFGLSTLRDQHQHFRTGVFVQLGPKSSIFNLVSIILHSRTCLSYFMIRSKWIPCTTEAWWNFRVTPKYFSSSFLLRCSNIRASTMFEVKLSEYFKDTKTELNLNSSASSEDYLR